MSISRIYHTISLFLKYPILLLRHNKISLRSEISSGLNARNVLVEDYVFIGRNCSISYARIGAYTCIAADTQVGGMEHPHWDLSISPRLSDQFVYGKQTVIGHDVWIGAGCIIRQGVIIGDGAVVGANSFVNRDVPPYTIVAGSPARVIKKRKIKNIERILNESKYWEEKPKRAIEVLKQIKEKEDIYE